MAWDVKRGRDVVKSSPGEIYPPNISAFLFFALHLEDHAFFFLIAGTQTARTASSCDWRRNALRREGTKRAAASQFFVVVFFKCIKRHRNLLPRDPPRLSLLLPQSKKPHPPPLSSPLLSSPLLPSPPALSYASLRVSRARKKEEGRKEEGRFKIICTRRKVAQQKRHPQEGRKEGRKEREATFPGAPKSLTKSSLILPPAPAPCPKSAGQRKLTEAERGREGDGEEEAQGAVDLGGRELLLRQRRRLWV